MLSIILPIAKNTFKTRIIPIVCFNPKIISGSRKFADSVGDKKRNGWHMMLINVYIYDSAVHISSALSIRKKNANIYALLDVKSVAHFARLIDKF